MSERTERICENCRFFFVTEYSESDPRPGDIPLSGECRRRAPVLPNTVSDDGVIISGVWPNIFVEEWCGDWKKRRKRDS